MTDIQEIASDRWRVKRENNGERVELESSILNFGTPTTVDTVRTIPVTFNTANLPNAPRNKVDSIYISVGVDFTNGCINTDSILCCVYPNFDTTYKGGICDNESFTWYLSDTHGYDDSVTYDTPQDPSTTFFHLTSVPGCDSLVRLKLVVSTVTHHTDTINDCAPITWIDSITYEESNYTAIVDTLKNMYGCDSVVHLHFTLYPLTARLHSNVEYFTFDNLDAVLTDISINGSSRVWKLPSMPDQTTPTAYYSIPVELDSAEILLIESSEYGQCIDTAKIVLPLNKENFWMPNVFTPDNPNGNNLFGSVSAKTLYQEMLIYNRRGELVFRCEGVDCTWDGRDLRGNPCVQDSYVYIIRYNNEYQPKNTKVIKGTVTLLR
jgi:gliding motility-associated-like protein